MRDVSLFYYQNLVIRHQKPQRVSVPAGLRIICKPDASARDNFKRCALESFAMSWQSVQDKFSACLNKDQRTIRRASFGEIFQIFCANITDSFWPNKGYAGRREECVKSFFRYTTSKHRSTFGKPDGKTRYIRHDFLPLHKGRCLTYKA